MLYYIVEVFILNIFSSGDSTQVLSQTTNTWSKQNKTLRNYRFYWPDDFYTSTYLPKFWLGGGCGRSSDVRLNIADGRADERGRHEVEEGVLDSYVCKLVSLLERNDVVDSQENVGRGLEQK